jgi:regulatory protein
MTAEDPDPITKALDAALRLLASRPWGEEELRARLRKRGFGSEAVDGCVERLVELRLLDDRAFAATLARHRIQLAPRGRFSLIRELLQRGVSRDVADSAVEGVLEDEGLEEGDLARKAVTAWLDRQTSGALSAFAGERGAERERHRRRLYGYLSRRGFNASSIREAMEAALEAARERLASSSTSGSP